MVELTRTNDPVLLSWLAMRLKQEDVAAFIFDTHTASVEGSIDAIQRRVMVADDDLTRARLVLQDWRE